MTKHVKRAIYTEVEQFLCDDDFIRYALDCAPDKESHWVSYLSAEPPVRAAYLKAYDILTRLNECQLLTPEQTQLLKERIFHTLHTSAS